jgi:branched-chain amino acid transport system ATP-binding protein
MSDVELLVVDEVAKRFGGVISLTGVSLTCRESEVLGLIGPNGSGKTTLINVIGGLIRPDRGKVKLEGRDITRYRPEVRARHGLRRTFQQSMIFPGMTVGESIKLAMEVSGSSSDLKGEKWRPSSLADLLNLCGLEEMTNERVEMLPQGKERLLGLALALSRPCRLLLLDEPGAGISAGESRIITDAVRAVRGSGTGVIVVDHHMDFLMGLVDLVVVLKDGSVIAEGTPAEIQQNAHVIEVYFGKSA